MDPIVYRDSGGNGNGPKSPFREKMIDRIGCYDRIAYWGHNQ